MPFSLEAAPFEKKAFSRQLSAISKKIRSQNPEVRSKNKSCEYIADLSANYFATSLLCLCTCRQSINPAKLIPRNLKPETSNFKLQTSNCFFKNL